MITEVRAAELAIRFHDGQVRKMGPDEGLPYIVHPMRVAATLRTWGCLRSVVALGWLHDVVEDTSATFEILRAEGLSDFQLEVLDAVTRRDGESYSDFILRVRRSGPAACDVKCADLTDNLAGLPEGHGLRARYEHAFEVLR